MLKFDQFATAQKSAVADFFALSTTLFGSVESLAKLNLQAAKATLEEATETTLTALSAKDIAELTALQTRVAQAAPEKATSYLRHVQAITTASSTEVHQFVETAAAGAKTEISNLVEAAVKNAPAGSENAVALVKSAVAAATNAIETAQQAAKDVTDKAVEAFEAK
jgi:phasin family protein